MPKKKGPVSRQTLWQRKHRAMGLCVVCSEPASKGWRCVKHYEQHKITMRLRYIPKVRGRYDVGGASEFLAAAAQDQGEPGKKKRAPNRGEKQKQTQAEAVPKASGKGKAVRARAATASTSGGSNGGGSSD